ncbi:hypothetical protein PBY51_013950 [Eleginops maclovinus]|uniref:Uncharacterized protein n=1 Tax=Eleginops maclovinus TaxID=56733 RepID=A0AAN7WVZ1_ELEMC|nr:hypothetical protein PBY51_013950 [Eleginops maclovinus]
MQEKIKHAKLHAAAWGILLHISLPTTVQKKGKLRRRLRTRSAQEPMAAQKLCGQRVRGIDTQGQTGERGDVFEAPTADDC